MQVVSNPRECDVIYGRKQPEYEYVNGTKKILLLISLPPLPRGDSPLLRNGPSVRYTCNQSTVTKVVKRVFRNVL